MHFPCHPFLLRPRTPYKRPPPPLCTPRLHRPHSLTSLKQTPESLPKSRTMKSLTLTFLLPFALISIAVAQSPAMVGLGASDFWPLPPKSTNAPFPAETTPFAGLCISADTCPLPTAAPTSVVSDPECRNTTVRTLSGRCTSIVDPTMGEAGRPQFSYFNVDNSHFSDEGLISAREISNIVAAQSEDTINSRRLSELFVFFGQFIDHDFALSPETGAEIDIEVPEDDPVLTVDELHFARSNRTVVFEGSNSERPITALSSALDLSQVYGVSKQRNAVLRVPNSCRMNTSDGDNLPFNTEGLVNNPTIASNFYIAGDVRATEHPVLTTMHTIFIREHNTICGRLENSFPDMDAESMYEIARAVNIAQYQKIVYNEWLPAILGPDPLPEYTHYKPDVDPTISLEFTTAGFRLGHTMVNNKVSRIDRDGNTLEPLNMSQIFFRDSRLVADDIENFLRGAAQTSAQEVDALVVNTLRNFLFANVPEVPGFDLIALNLQRGRDHNVPRFNQLRRFFLDSTAKSFEDISSDSETQKRLEEAYGTVENIEAWIGLMAEDKEPGTGIGRTNAALWKTEFTRLRDGDRFFYLDNDRHQQIPQEVLEAIPAIKRDVVMAPMVFRRVLLRNTGIQRADVPGGNIFRI
eukprot:TRINITY_DN24622_c0_g1_i1.p1 TRINITY_DN24622_c0_g1~~TRINITY_DN24622_c0_g1_i1.p1  ORF type:complete len:636 (+),score=83.21 TRINITY_DN24622_c0_g1_i1:175-2082(+)